MEAAGLCDLGFAGYPLLPQRWIEWIGLGICEGRRDYGTNIDSFMLLEWNNVLSTNTRPPCSRLRRCKVEHT